ncbi:hypothetical protein F5883DRAFT_549193 [Diaporthe sp. PMI_573]|nr:hypothetical protein F5883DRAFT_549193 [Diaporthaceae sp. PMI_573]
MWCFTVLFSSLANPAHQQLSINDTRHPAHLLASRLPQKPLRKHSGCLPKDGATPKITGRQAACSISRARGSDAWPCWRGRKGWRIGERRHTF